MTKVFEAIQTPDEKEWVIVLNVSLFNGSGMWGTGGVIASRLLGITYPNYLRLCRDVYGAELRGKKGYSNAYFKKFKQVAELVDTLNACYSQLEAVVDEKELGQRELEYFKELNETDPYGVFYVKWRP